jgi:excisionase family DNA binding protein
MNGARALTLGEAADLLKVPRKTLSTWVHRRTGPHVRLAARTVRFDEQELRAWWDAKRVPTK